MPKLRKDDAHFKIQPVTLKEQSSGPLSDLVVNPGPLDCDLESLGSLSLGRCGELFRVFCGHTFSNNSIVSV